MDVSKTVEALFERALAAEEATECWNYVDAALHAAQAAMTLADYYKRMAGGNPPGADLSD